MDIYEIARKEFEKYYDSKMAVSINKPVKDGPFTKNDWVEEHKDVPCRISQKQLNPTTDSVSAGLSYVTILYCSNDIDIAAGSRIEITNPDGETRKYKRSSEGFDSYRTHQEIVIQREATA